MKKYAYDYYIVELETDFFLFEQQNEKMKAITENRIPVSLPYSVRNAVYIQAEEKSRFYVIPCEWESEWEILDYTLFAKTTVFKVRRKRPISTVKKRNPKK